MKTEMNVATKSPANVAAKVPRKILDALTGFTMTMILSAITFVLLFIYDLTGANRTATAVAGIVWAIQAFVPMAVRGYRLAMKGGEL